MTAQHAWSRLGTVVFAGITYCRPDRSDYLFDILFRKSARTQNHGDIAHQRQYG